MAKELAKQYDPKGTEDRIYQEWCDKGYFHTQIDRSKKPFTIVMPPPNVTGQLHMGHAMDLKKTDTGKFYSNVFAVFRTFCFLAASGLMLLTPWLASLLLQPRPSIGLPSGSTTRPR